MMRYQARDAYHLNLWDTGKAIIKCGLASLLGLGGGGCATSGNSGYARVQITQIHSETEPGQSIASIPSLIWDGVPVKREDRSEVDTARKGGLAYKLWDGRLSLAYMITYTRDPKTGEGKWGGIEGILPKDDEGRTLLLNSFMKLGVYNVENPLEERLEGRDNFFEKAGITILYPISNWCEALKGVVTRDIAPIAGAYDFVIDKVLLNLLETGSYTAAAIPREVWNDILIWAPKAAGSKGVSNFFTDGRAYTLDYVTESFLPGTILWRAAHAGNKDVQVPVVGFLFPNKDGTASTYFSPIGQHTELKLNMNFWWRLAHAISTGSSDVVITGVLVPKGKSSSKGPSKNDSTPSSGGGEPPAPPPDFFGP